MTYILQTQGTNSKDWAPLVRAHRAQFLLTAASLLSCACCAEDIVKQSLEELGGSYVPERFQYRYALRIVVQGALRHLRVCPMTSNVDRSQETDHGAAFSFKALPLQERAVLFLRDVLDYSRRDVSLLVGISDVQADRLLALARRRLAGGTTALPRASIQSTSAHLNLDIGQQSFTKELTSNVIH
jgi:DNA-directed RNA polymerase specialized sigma24 family protein